MRTKIIGAFTGAAMLAGCGSTIDPTGDNISAITGGLIGAGVATEITDNDYVQALAVILGASAGQAISRRRYGGCVRTGSTNPVFSGGHVFYNPRLGVIQCPPSSLANSGFVDQLYRDPNWQPVTYQRRSRGSSYYYGPHRGPEGFNFMHQTSSTIDADDVDLSRVTDNPNDIMKVLNDIYGSQIALAQELKSLRP